MAKVFWYQFENNCTDSSGSGRDATNYGTSGYVSDDVVAGTYARSFNTSSDYTSTATPGLKPAYWTVKTRVRFTGTMGGYWFSLSSNVGGILIGFIGSKIGLRVYDDNATAWRDVYDTQAAKANTWYDVHATFDGSYLRLYVNGVETGTAYPLASWEKTYGNVLTLGRYYSSGYWCQSDMGECWMDDTAWTATDILNDFNNDFGISAATDTTFKVPLRLSKLLPATTWNTIDVDDIVGGSGLPSSASGVIVRYYEENYYSRYFGVRKKGSTDARINPVRFTCGSTFFVGIDSNHQFEIYNESPSYTYVEILGFFKSSNTIFLTNGVDVTPAGLTWASVDCSAVVPAGAVAVILEVVSTNMNAAFDVRKPGDTVDLTNTNLDPGHYGFIAPLDGSRVFQCAKKDAGVTVYVVGYVTVGTFFNTRSDVSLGTSGSWQSMDLSALSPPVGSQAVLISHQVSTNVVATVTKSNEILGDLDSAAVIARDCHVVSTISGTTLKAKIGSTNIDHYVSGFIGGPVSGNGSGTISEITGRMGTDNANGSFPNLTGTANGFWCYIGGSSIGEITGFSQGTTNLGNHARGSINNITGFATVTIPMVCADGSSASTPLVMLAKITGSATLVPGTAGTFSFSWPKYAIQIIESGKIVGSYPKYIPTIVQANITYGSLIGNVVKPVMSFFGLEGSVGTLRANIPLFTFSTFKGYEGTSGSMAARYPRYLFRGVPVTITLSDGTTITALAVCISNGAVSEFMNFAPTSLGVVGSAIVYTDKTGIYTLEGTTDNGAIIPARIKTGQDDFAMSGKKGTPDIYFGTQGGETEARITHHGAVLDDWQQMDSSTTITTKRITPGKGTIQRFVGVELRNVEGSDFILHSMGIRIAPINRRINESK